MDSETAVVSDGWCGKTSPLTGQLAEIVLYNKALSDADRKKVECYLGLKYGISISGCP